MGTRKCAPSRCPPRGTRDELQGGGQERFFRVRSVLSCCSSSAEVTPEPRTCLWPQECPARAQDGQPPKPVSFYALFTWRPSQASIPPASTPGCPHMNPRAEGLCPALPAPVLVGSASLGTRFSTPFCKVAPLQTPVPTSSLNNVLSNVPSFTKVSFTFY